MCVVLATYLSRSLSPLSSYILSLFFKELLSFEIKQISNKFTLTLLFSANANLKDYERRDHCSICVGVKPLRFIIIYAHTRWCLQEQKKQWRQQRQKRSKYHICTNIIEIFVVIVVVVFVATLFKQLALHNPSHIYKYTVFEFVKITSVLKAFEWQEKKKKKKKKKKKDKKRWKLCPSLMLSSPFSRWQLWLSTVSVMNLLSSNCYPIRFANTCCCCCCCMHW